MTYRDVLRLKLDVGAKVNALARIASPQDMTIFWGELTRQLRGKGMLLPFGGEQVICSPDGITQTEGKRKGFRP